MSSFQRDPSRSPTDLEILEHQQSVVEAHTSTQLLVGPQEPLAALAKEYRGSESFRAQIERLTQDYQAIRRCRGDGNCFYRAFAMGWYEAVHSDPRRCAQALRTLEESADCLQQVGFESLVFEDFLKTATDTLHTLQCTSRDSPADAEALLEQSFQTPEVSNSIVVYLRMLTSAFLRQHQDDYLPFLEGEPDMVRFCTGQVEAMGVESEEIHLIALTRALGVSLRVVYLDGSPRASESGRPVTIHPFPNAEECAANASSGVVTLLYRPGHYDLIYPNHPTSQ
ncbi:peptidase C65 Otubain-domain-containing protein [Dimargaris cristalligena]|uniref:ubiquitinyl hydrolase 1 n=1 Tax=Dimargaris cristalligena TaxID=215637 RepID=A0A4V1J4T5_9FUNG|nr:peptidase C65 Otubain-domain-containing protein [Dimargaris cristalligena]|eukprot:RKP36679.1 peptidase C65 Otubain-domain-containing protein [Dimargaris cristalligena]